MAARKKTAAAVEVTPATPAEVRAWGNENGFTVAARGRIAAAVVAAFTEKTGRPPVTVSAE